MDAHPVSYYAHKGHTHIFMRERESLSPNQDELRTNPHRHEYSYQLYAYFLSILSIACTLRLNRGLHKTECMLLSDTEPDFQAGAEHACQTLSCMMSTLHVVMCMYCEPRVAE